jgi:hypothetical protein
MNVEIIFEVCHATLGGTMSFPDAAGKLMGGDGRNLNRRERSKRRRFHFLIQKIFVSFVSFC